MDWKLIPVKVGGVFTTSRPSFETSGLGSLTSYDGDTTGGQSSTHTQHAESDRDDFGTIVTEVPLPSSPLARSIELKTLSEEPLLSRLVWHLRTFFTPFLAERVKYAVGPSFAFRVLHRYPYFFYIQVTDVPYVKSRSYCESHTGSYEGP